MNALYFSQQLISQFFELMCWNQQPQKYLPEVVQGMTTCEPATGLWVANPRDELLGSVLQHSCETEHHNVCNEGECVPRVELVVQTLAIRNNRSAYMDLETG